jgi:hypothetical protein
VCVCVCVRTIGHASDKVTSTCVHCDSVHFDGVRQMENEEAHGDRDRGWLGYGSLREVMECSVRMRRGGGRAKGGGKVRR